MAGVGMSLAGVVMVMIVAVKMPGHAPILRAQISQRRDSTRLLGSLTPWPAEWIDGLSNGCDDETSFPMRVDCRGTRHFTGDRRSATWQFRLQN
jgi:hypothetical protein